MLRSPITTQNKIQSGPENSTANIVRRSRWTYVQWNCTAFSAESFAGHSPVLSVASFDFVYRHIQLNIDSRAQQKLANTIEDVREQAIISKILRGIHGVQ